MRYALLDDQRTITNIIEVSEEMAIVFNAHFLGASHLGIGDTYPDPDLPVEYDPAPDLEPTIDERVDALEAKVDENMTAIEAAIERGLNL